MVQAFAVLALLALPAYAAQDEGAGDEGFEPHVEPASSEGEEALARFELQEGFRADLFAAEPYLANPVCFAIDERGRFYVGETFRHFAGVTDIRNHMDWLDDDLASRTVADRVAMFRKFEGESLAEYSRATEQVRLVEDTDGDGRADRATVFADGFDDPAAGIGAGLLARNGDVYYACIPDLWLLSDTDGDGRADERRVLHTGYGVRVALLGHDLHGLRMGPDGRLYFSIGDRGFHVETEGRTLAHPYTGAVLRCEPDGSNLEVFATGLRNPQELVFDDHGDLFTGDNNSDGGDRARWVWVLEGGDSGWRQSYQWITRPNLRGPWNAESLWHPPFAGQAAYVNPPIANIASGPSGLTYYPGTGFGDRWRGHFFLCDFRGDPSYSGVHTFRVEEKGAGFELVDPERFLWNSLVTDVEFGWDGGLYVSDWVQGWNKTGKGRIYRVALAEPLDDPRAAEAARLVADGMDARSDGELAALLGHADGRVRLAAQYALADRGGAALLFEAAAYAHVPLARLHAVWGLGQLARGAGVALEPLVPLLADADPEVRCQAARVLGEARCAAAADGLTRLLADGHPRARLFAAIALGKLGRADSAPPLVAMLRANDDADPWLRHAGVQGLVTIGDEGAVLAFADDPAPAVRRAVVVALRRFASAAVARFLDDPEPGVAVEAARAVYDVPILPAMEALAVRLERLLPDDPAFARRALNANRRLGGERGARRIAGWLQRGEGAESVRVEALEILAHWANPVARDRVTGEWVPIHREGAAHELFLPRIAAELEAACTRSGSERTTTAWIRMVGAVRAEGCASALSALLDGENARASAVRKVALATLAELGAAGWRDAVRRALFDADDAVRGEAFALLEGFEPDEAIRWITPALEEGGRSVRQSAFRSLGRLEHEAADRLLVRWLERLENGAAPPDVALDILEAAESRGEGAVAAALARVSATRPADDPLAAWRACLEGGDAESGRRVFFEKAEVTCLRCHRIGDEGGSEAGPDLTQVGQRLERAELLASIVLPNARIAEGYENWVHVLDDGTLVAGRLLAEEETTVTLEVTEGGRVHAVALERARIVESKRGVSSMPEDLAGHLDRRELRDLVEFLAGLSDG